MASVHESHLASHYGNVQVIVQAMSPHYLLHELTMIMHVYISIGALILFSDLSDALLPNHGGGRLQQIVPSRCQAREQSLALLRRPSPAAPTPAVLILTGKARSPVAHARMARTLHGESHTPHGTPPSAVVL
jgi:hypothetical protein